MPTEASPLVTVIVPVFNVERYISDCIHSIRAQTYRHLEILIVEDCSTDRSHEKLREHTVDPRIRIIQHAQNRGLSAARNTGIRESTGDYILFIDSDDLVQHSLISNCVHAAQSGTADILVFDYLPFKDEQSSALQITRDDHATIVEITRNEYLQLPHFAWLKFTRASLVKGVGEAFPEGYFYEDWPFHWKIGITASTICRLGIKAYYYRQRATSITAAYDARLLDLLRVQGIVQEMLDSTNAPDDAKLIFAKKSLDAMWAVITGIDDKHLRTALTFASAIKSAFPSNAKFSAWHRKGKIMYLLLSAPTPVTLWATKVIRESRRIYRACKRPQR